MVTVEFDFMGEVVRLALVAEEYVGGGLAVLLLDATDPRSDGYMADRSAASGMARYPLATVAGHVLEGMGSLLETLEEALGSTVVVEYESGGDGGAFEVGTAPVGSPELGRLIAAARPEADALAAAGGWAAVRVGFGDAETIDCETGRTVYATGAE